MLQNIKNLYGANLAAPDGDIGHVKDFYFDDTTWAIRHLVAETGPWMTGRLVLLSPQALGKWDPYGNTLHVTLPKMQIENSPSIAPHPAVSRRDEIEHPRHHGLPNYQDDDAKRVQGDQPPTLAPSKNEILSIDPHHHPEDRHVRSTQAVTSYQIQAVDGAIGSLSGFVVDDKNWAISELAVETGPWHPGSQILIAPDNIMRISDEDATVFVNLSKADIRATAQFDRAQNHPTAPEAAFPINLNEDFFAKSSRAEATVGRGTLDSKMVYTRMRKLAAIAGRVPPRITDALYAQAKREQPGAPSSVF